MRRALLLTSVLLAACAASGGAMAQSTNSEGLRYLSWPGKPAAPRAAVQPGREAAPQPTRVAANTPAGALPLARLDAPAPTPVAPRNGLTPASAFYSPTPAPAPQPYAAPTPAPAPVHAEAPRPVPVATPAPEPAPLPAAAVTEAPADPMAPRQDAPIFRLQRQAAAEAAPQPTEQAPAESRRAEAASQTSTQAPVMTQAALAPVQGARFYSVHRQAGRQPDAINTPQPIYLDALPVEMAQTPSSTDLAQPDAPPPALLRNSNGTVRAMPQTQADDLP